MAKQVEFDQGLPGHDAAPAGERVSLLTEVDFKWLMAGQGCWVDSTRLQADDAYANDILRQARASKCPALRECAASLQAQMAASAPPTKAPGD
jgi:hypothetical protein